MPFSRAQVNAEYLTVLGISLLVVLVFMVLSSDVLTGLGVQRNTDDAQKTVSSLARAADFVYGQGEGAQERVPISLPGTTVFGPGSTYIGKPESAGQGVQARSISINVAGSDVSAITDANLQGYFPPAPGDYVMKVESRGSYVSITPYLVDVDTHSVFVSMPKSSNRNITIIVYKVPSETVNATALYNWGFDSANLTVSPPSLLADANGSGFTLMFRTYAGASGIYSSQLTILATGASGMNETVRIPITLDVQG